MFCESKTVSLMDPVFAAEIFCAWSGVSALALSLLLRTTTSDSWMTSEFVGLSYDETFGTDNLDPPPPFDLNILAHVSDEVIVSNHATIQDRVDEELGNENDVFPLIVDEQCQTEYDDVNHDRLNEDTHNGLEMNTSRVDEHLDNDNAPLETAT
nr:hypothetical protein [Tanacetum cinerariifolium]